MKDDLEEAAIVTNVCFLKSVFEQFGWSEHCWLVLFLIS